MLYTPDGGVHAPEYEWLARQLHDGDGLGWPGDPRLSLRLGILTHKRTGRTMRRIEIWRWNEDGTDTMIGSWHPSERDKVCHDLAKMRLGRPGGGNVIEEIDAHNAKLEAEADAKRRDVMADNLARRVYDLIHRVQGHAKTTFSVPSKKGNDAGE